MRLVSFRDQAGSRIGVLDGSRTEIADLSILAPDLPREMTRLICLGDQGLEQVRNALGTREHRIRPLPTRYSI